MSKYFILFLFTLLIFSCTRQEEQKQQTPFSLKVVKANGYVVPKDSMGAPTVVFVDESKLKKIPVGRPKVVFINTNVYPAGIPKIVLAGVPKEVTPGKDTFSLPKTVPAIAHPVMAGMPEVVIAKDASTKDQNPQNFSYFGKLQGLKTGIITCMLQDKSGNLWFGTRGGVSKYDGKFFTNFTVKEGLASNNVISISEDLNGNLWFGTWGEGVSKYDGNFFTHFSIKEGLSNKFVMSILADKRGNLWFGTYGGGVFRLSRDGKFFTDFTNKEGLAGNVVFSILEDTQGNLWFGTWNGLSKYDGRSFTNYNVKEGLGNNIINSIAEDKKGNLWIGSNNGVVKYNGKTFTSFTENEGLSNNNVRSIIEDNRGDLWFGTGGGGATRLSQDGNYFTHYTEKEGLSNMNVLSILEDRSGNLWFGTSGGGIARLSRDGRSFTHFTDKEGLSGNFVGPMLEDRNGNLWIGTSGGGVSKFDGISFTHFTVKEGLSNNNVTTIAEDKNGNLWFGSGNGGVSRLGWDGKYFTQFTGNEGFPSIYILSLITDKGGNLWFGTYGYGLKRYDGKFLTNINSDRFDPTNNAVLSISEDRNGNIWYGTDGAGVSKYDGKVITKFIDNEDVSNKTVNAILEDRNGNLWFGMAGGGLTLLSRDGKFFTLFTEKDGLCSDYVYSILEDKSGNLWFGTRFGLSMMSRAKLAEISGNIELRNAKAPEVLFKNYRYEDGFLGIGCSSICEDKNGTIWFGATDRLTAYHPPAGGENEDTVAPNIQLTGIDLFNEKIAWAFLEKKKDSTLILGNGILLSNFKFDSTTKWFSLPMNLSLAYNNNYLTFNFVGVTMNSPRKVKYRYKMEGLDKNWSAVTSRTDAPYGNLPQGTYTFKVKAMNSDGYWSKEYHYTFTIRPPWWKTWWAYALYLFAVIGSIWYYIKWREKSLKTRQRLLEQKVDERTHELKETQSQLVQQEKLASLGALTAGIAHEIKNPLNFVNNFAELNNELIDELENSKDEEERKELFQTIKQNLSKINEHGKRADSIVKNMLEHSRTGAGEKQPTDINKLCDEYLNLAYHGMRAGVKDFNCNIERHFAENLPKLNIVPQDISRVLLNLINNAFYAIKDKPDATLIMTTMTIMTTIPSLIIKIKDNGPGIPESIKQKIFEPFFTTKPAGSGTGLGLSLSFDIIKAHGGRIEVDSKENEYTEFKITLPL
jgi:ligand-binding sensor domain-containing protein/signal transduction histidine kinase